MLPGRTEDRMSDPRIVFANDLPFSARHADPFESLKDMLALSADDWGETRAKAWVYGIVLGWDYPEDDGETMAELADKFDWSDEQVARLRQLHKNFDVAAFERRQG